MRKKLLFIVLLGLSKAFSFPIVVNNNTSTSFTATTAMGKVIGRIATQEQGHRLEFPESTPVIRFKGDDGEYSAVFYKEGVLQCTSQTWYPCKVSLGNVVTILNPGE